MERKVQIVADAVALVAHGQDKAQALKAVLEGSHEPAHLPAQLIRPAHGTLWWLVDRCAAALLDPSTIIIPTKIAG